MPMYNKTNESSPARYDDVTAILQDMVKGDYTKDEIDDNMSYKSKVVNTLAHTALLELSRQSPDSQVPIVDALTADSDTFNTYINATFETALAHDLSDMSVVKDVLADTPLSEFDRRAIFDNYSAVMGYDINVESVNELASLDFMQELSDEELDTMFSSIMFGDDIVERTPEPFDVSNVPMDIQDVDYSKGSDPKVKQSLEEIEFLNDIDKKLDWLAEKDNDPKPIAPVNTLVNPTVSNNNSTKKSKPIVHKDDDLEL